MKNNNKLMMLTLLAISLSGQFLMSSVEVDFEKFKSLASSNGVLVRYLSTGVNPNTITTSDPSITSAYLRNATRPTLLTQAAEYGNVTVIKTLINRGVDINKKGGAFMSPVGTAIWAGNIDVVQLLVNVGANLNQHEYKFDSALELADYVVKQSSNEKEREIYQKIKDIVVAGPAPRGIATSVRQAPADEPMNSEVSRT